MDFACLLAPHFAIQVELRRRPQLAGRPLVLTTRQRTVLDASPLAKGLQPGMPLEEAMGRCKGAVVVEADPESYRQAWSDVLDSLEERSIALEDTALGQACMDVRGLDCLYGGQAKLAVLLLNAAPPWLQVRVGLGPNRFTSFVAAGRAGRDSASCVEGDAAAFLRGAAVDLLPVEWRVKERLLGFGLRTLEQVVAVGLGPMQAEFGPQGKLAWELATGVDQRPLVHRIQEQIVSSSLTFDAPTTVLATVLLGAERLLNRAFRHEAVHGRAARVALFEGAVHDGGLWRRRVAFWPPASDAAHASGPVKRALSGVVLPGPLEAMNLTLSGLTGEVGRQGSLLPEVRQRERLREALAQLEALEGHKPIYRLREVEPWSRIPERRMAFAPCDS